MYDIAKLAKEKGLSTSMVSNGYINEEPLCQLLQVLDAVKIDFKAYTREFYNQVCSGQLQPVLETLKTIKEQGVWLEIVNLVVPTLNDDSSDIRGMCQWIKEQVGSDVPLHFTRFFPMYRLTNLSPTPVETLERAYKIAKEVGLRYVYIGNVPSHIQNSTFCPNCYKVIIHRIQFSVISNEVFAGKCSFCGEPIAGLW